MKEKVGFIGLGLIGGSLAQAFPTKKYRSSKPKSLARKSLYRSGPNANSTVELSGTPIFQICPLLSGIVQEVAASTHRQLAKSILFLITAKIIYAAKEAIFSESRKSYYSD